MSKTYEVTYLLANDEPTERMRLDASSEDMAGKLVQTLKPGAEIVLVDEIVPEPIKLTLPSTRSTKLAHDLSMELFGIPDSRSFHSGACCVYVDIPNDSRAQWTTAKVLEAYQRLEAE